MSSAAASLLINERAEAWFPHGAPAITPPAPNVWMEAPDILAFTVSDVPAVHGNDYDTGSPQSNNYNTWYSVANPRDGGASEQAKIISYTKQVWKFNDLPSTGFVNRLALRSAANYTINNGLSVTAVYFRQEENSQIGQATGGNVFSITQTITVYLKLSAAPTQNVTYTVSHSSSAFPTFAFTYNDKVTRAGGIRVSVGGHKPNDPAKIAYLCSRIPGNPGNAAAGLPAYGDPGTNGSIDFGATYGITSFQILDSSGASVFSGSATLRCLVSDMEKPVTFTGFIDNGLGGGSPSGVAGTKLTVTAITNGYISNGNTILGAGITASTTATWVSGTQGSVGVYNVNNSQLVNPAEAMYVPDAYPVGIDVADTSQSWTITSITTGPSTTTINFSGGHGFSNGDKIRFRGISGMTQLEGSPYISHAWIAQTVTVINGTTITIPLNTSSGYSPLTTGTYSALLGGYENQAYKCFNTNRAGCTVYGLDYSSFTPASGNYYLYIPGFGISDPIPIGQTQWATNASLHHKGIYNLRHGIALSLAGYNRGVSLLDGVSPTNNYWSNLPALWSTESGTFGPASGYNLQAGSAAYLVTVAGYVPMGTSNQATGSRPGHQDAGDNDDLTIDHAPSWSSLAWLFEFIQKNRGASSCVTSFAVPLSSAVCDSTIFAGTDSAAPLFHEMVWWAESLRTMQDTNPADTVLYGSIPGGYGIGHFSQQTPNDCEPISLYRGTDPNLATPDGGVVGAFLYAPDHLSGLFMVQFFAKMAIICYNYGFGTAGDTYKNAATLLLNWCEGIASNTTTRDNYYITHLGFYTSMNTQHSAYTMTQYNADMAGVLTRYNNLRPSVLATMWRLSGINSNGVYPAAGAPTPDWTDYGSAADAVYSSLTGLQGGMDYAQCSSYPNYNATHKSYILGGHWTDTIGGPQAAANAISTNTSFATNQWNNLGGIYTSFFNVVAHMADVFNTVSPSTSNNLKAPLANFAFIYGANLRGRQYVVGQGPRSTILVDHLDSWRLGQPSPTGSLPFSFITSGWGGYSLGTYFNLGVGSGADNTSTFIASNTTGANEAGYGSKKVIEPWPQAQAAWEWSPQNNNIINICEFTIASLLQTLACALWLHAWDGSHL